MDINPLNNLSTQPISDDQDLAQALAGVLPEDPAPEAPATSMQFEETPAPAVAGAATGDQPEVQSAPTPEFSMPEPLAAAEPASEPSLTGADLTDIKASALNSLRPLISRVDLPAEEKFDTYLMLIRSTDDSSLIEPAHTAAQNITDEKRKAEALLDIIKEIDYLSRKDK